MIYDFIIVGSGPSSLALAHCLSYKKLKILIIDKENSIGGCHRVNRVNYNDEKLFTEHGPRVYSSAYKNFDMLLKDMNTSFDELFIPYNFQMTTVGNKTILSTLSFFELFKLTYNMILLMFDEDYGNNISMKEYLTNNNYQPKSIDIIDRICRLTDGGDINKYTLNKFLQLINQQILYKLYQPKFPTDEGLLPIWKDFLKNRGVKFMLNTEINKINTKDDTITSLNILNNKKEKDKELKANNYILAIPPKNIVSLLYTNDNIKNAFGDFNKLKEWAENTEYLDYISITFHWNKNLNLPNVYGFTKSDWGLVFIKLTDYMKFGENTSKTLISTAVTITDKKSKYNGKTANECNKDEVIKEVLMQLKESYPDLPEPSASIMTPNNYFNNEDKTWDSKDNAFISSYKSYYIPFQSEIIKNLYNLGTHNGKSSYSFTSLESAISNSIALSHIFYPELKDKYKHKRGYTLRDIILIILLIIFIGIVIYLITHFIKFKDISTIVKKAKIRKLK
jgi:predicted NAD/FAD-dependent oxidoreductase